MRFVLLEKAASVIFLLPMLAGLPSFQYRTVPMRSRACDHLRFETTDAVVGRVGVLCVDVRRCEMWKTYCFTTNLIAGHV